MLDHGLRFALNSVHLVRNPLSLDCATPDSHRDIGAGSNVVEILFLFFHYYFVSLKPFITKITDFNWVLLGTVQPGMMIIHFCLACQSIPKPTKTPLNDKIWVKECPFCEASQRGSVDVGVLSDGVEKILKSVNRQDKALQTPFSPEVTQES